VSVEVGGRIGVEVEVGSGVELELLLDEDAESLLDILIGERVAEQSLLRTDE
jgi:hypothetical protein